MGQEEVCSDPQHTHGVSGRLFLENSKLEHSEDESAVLGQGGSGTVIYRARYQGQPVAVGQPQIKKFKNFANAPAGKQGPGLFLSDMSSLGPNLYHLRCPVTQAAEEGVMPVWALVVLLPGETRQTEHQAEHA